MSVRSLCRLNQLTVEGGILLVHKRLVDLKLSQQICNVSSYYHVHNLAVWHLTVDQYSLLRKISSRKKTVFSQLQFWLYAKN